VAGQTLEHWARLFGLEPDLPQQRVLTVVAPVDAGCDPGAIRARMKQWSPTIKRVRSAHFMQFTVLRTQHPPRLLYSAIHDGPRVDHIAELVSEAHEILAAMYAFCPAAPLHGEDYAQVGDEERIARWIAFMNGFAHEPRAFYLSHEGLSVDAIREMDEVRRTVVDALAKGPEETLARPQAALASVSSVMTAAQRWRARTQLPIMRRSAWRWVAGLWALVKLVPLLLLHLLASLLLLRWLERHDDCSLPRTDWERLLRHEETEKDMQRTQNHLAHLVPVKRGWYRRWTLRLVLRIVDAESRYRFKNPPYGSLAGLLTIHFAYWTIVDGEEGGEELLFVSNYDFTWHEYISDFILLAAPYMTAIWSNTEHFPRTRWLIGDGVRDEQAFKNWTRYYQVDHGAWFGSYQHLSVREVWRNLDLFRALADPAQAAADWLQHV
jgi:hypothetical protein